MPALFQCPHCRKQYKTGGKTIGKRVKCKRCEKVFTATAVDADAVTIRDEPVDTGKHPSIRVDDAPEAKTTAEFTVDDAKTLWQGTVGADQNEGETIKAEEEGSDSVTTTAFLFSHTITKHGTSKPGDNQFELIKLIGKGGMGAIFSAKQASMDREIAIKMILPEQADNDATKTKFISEALVTGELDHPNIVPVHEVGKTADGTLFYAMKEVKGTNWKDVIEEKSESENLQILMDVCDAVAFAHDHGVVHRDLKPENIMLGDYGEVLVMDWGLAVCTEEGGKAEPITGKMSKAGTPAYMAPEMATCRGARLGPWSDIYLLGGILYEIVTGLKPHSGEGGIFACIYHAMSNEIQESDVEGELKDIALTAMATDPPDRYESVKDFQAAIRKYQSHLESIILCEKAQKDLRKAEKKRDYDIYAKALFGFRQASDLWPDNEPAQYGVVAAQLAYAECALDKGDLDLAASQLDRKAKEHKSLLKQVKQAQQQRTARQKRLKLLTGVSIAAGLSIVIGAVVAALLIHTEQQATLEQKNKAEVAVKETEKALAQVTEQKNRAVKAEKTATEETKRAQRINEFLTSTLGSADPGKTGKDIKVVELMDRTSKTVDARFRDDPKVCCSIHLTLGDTYRSLGKLDRAEHHLSRAMGIARDLYEPESEKMLNVRSGWAQLLYAKGSYAEARRFLSEIHETKKRVLGAEHPLTLGSTMNLARILFSQGKHTEAKKLFQRVLLTYKRTLGPAHPVTLKNMGNLAGILHSEGKHSEAEKMYREVLEKMKRIRGAEHPDTLFGMNNLAIVLHAQGKALEAEKTYLELLETQKRVFGVEHPEVLRSMGNLAAVLQGQGKYAEGEKVNREVLALEKRVLGPEHPNTLNSISNLANALYHQRKYDEAGQIYRDVLKIQKRVLGQEHPNTLISMAGLAFVSKAKGDYTEAAKAYRKVLEVRKRVLGPEHPETISNMNSLALTLKAQGKHAESEEVYREELKLRKRVLGPEHLETLRCMDSLVDVLLLQEKNSEAVTISREVLEKRKRTLGPTHPGGLKAVQNLTEALVRQLELNEAREVLAAAVKHRPTVWQIWGQHATVCLALDKQSDFKTSLSQVMKQHPDPNQVRAQIIRHGQHLRTQYEGSRLEGRELTTAQQFAIRGHYRASQKRWDEARKDLLASLKLDESVGLKGIYRTLSRVMEKQEDWKGMLDVHRKWVQAAPENYQTQNGYAIQLLNSRDKKLRDPKKALIHARKAAELTQNRHPAILDTLGLALFRNGKIQEAVNIQKKAVGLLPANFPPAMRKGYEDRLVEYEAALKKTGE